MNLSDLHNSHVLRPRFLSAAYTAKPGDMCYVDSGSTAITVTLPASPNVDTYVGVWDANNNANANNITIARNGQTIQGVAEDWVINVDSGRVDLVFDGTTWQVAFVTVGGLNQAQVDARVALNPSLGDTKYIGQNLQTDNYELVLSDAGFIVEIAHADPKTLTIPANASVAFPVNTRIEVQQGGAGQITVAITSDTLRGDPKTQDQYKAVSLWKRDTTEWVVWGGTT